MILYSVHIYLTRSSIIFQINVSIIYYIPTFHTRFVAMEDSKHSQALLRKRFGEVHFEMLLTIIT